MIKVITTKEVASRYKGTVSVMRHVPRNNNVELYMCRSIFNIIQENESPETYEVVYDSANEK